MLLIPKNTGDTVFSVRKTKIATEYRENGIRFFKNLIFQINQFLIDCQSNTFLLMNIITSDISISFNYNCRIGQRKISAKKCNINNFASNSFINK